MFRTRSNAKEIGGKYHKRAARLKKGVRKGMRRIAVMIDAEQVKNLRGGADAPAGSFPIPIRSADLFQSHFFKVTNERLAVVGNASGHAVYVHADRPFLELAVEAVDANKEMSHELDKAMAV